MNYDIFLKYNKKKIAISKNFEYGINEKSTIFGRIVSEENIYKIMLKESKIDSREPERSIDSERPSSFKQISAYVEAGAIINIFKREHDILSSYFLFNPGISYIYPANDSFYSFSNSTVTVGAAYGISQGHFYAELALLDKIHFNSSNHEVILGVTVGIKPKDKIEFFLNTTLSSGAREEVDPALEAYIKENSDYDKFYNKINDNYMNFSDQLKDMFSPKKRYPYAKMVLGTIYKWTDHTSISFEVGTSIVWKPFESQYIALGLRRRL